MKKHVKKFILASFFITLLTSIALAIEVNQVNGDRINGTRDFSAADSAAVDSTAYAEPPIALKGRRTILVSPHLSGSAATCKVALALGTYDGSVFKAYAWVETATLTASSTFKDTTGGLYLAPSAELTTGNWTHFKVYITALSTGSGRIEWSAY